MEFKIKRKDICKKYIAQNLIFFIISYKREKLDSDFGRFLAKHVLRIGYYGNGLGPWWPKSIPNDV